MGNRALVIFLLFAIAAPLQSQSQTTTETQPSKGAAKPRAVPAKSKALLAAENRIAELEAELDDTHKKLAAADAELKPLKKTMADIAAAAVPLSKIAPTDTIGRNRAVLFVDPSGALLWYGKSSEGTYYLATLNDQSDSTTLKDVVAKGLWRSVTTGDLAEPMEKWVKKAQEDYNALVDKYNDALALLKQSNELASQEQAFIQQMRAYTAATQAAERQARISNALAVYGLMQHQTYAPPPIVFAPPTLPRPTINCTSTALVPGMVNTTCQ